MSRQPRGARSNTRPKLADVAVVAADTLAPHLAARALDLCMERCDFGDAILFSDTAVSGRFRHVAIPPLKSRDDYSRFCIEDMPRLTEAPFVLVVQWDGYVVDAAMWSNVFRKFDYVGRAALSAERRCAGRQRRLLAPQPPAARRPPRAAAVAGRGAGRRHHLHDQPRDAGARFRRQLRAGADRQPLLLRGPPPRPADLRLPRPAEFLAPRERRRDRAPLREPAARRAHQLQFVRADGELPPARPRRACREALSARPHRDDRGRLRGRDGQGAARAAGAPGARIFWNEAEAGAAPAAPHNTNGITALRSRG